MKIASIVKTATLAINAITAKIVVIVKIAINAITAKIVIIVNIVKIAKSVL